MLRAWPSRWLSLSLAAAAQAADLRGFASLGPHGLILFQPCDGKKPSTRTLRVEDETPDAVLSAGIDEVRKIMLESGRPLYVEFRGDTAGLVVTARQFQRALGTVAACGAAPRDIAPGTRLSAYGDDPSWHFVVTGAEWTARATRVKGQCASRRRHSLAPQRSMARTS